MRKFGLIGYPLGHSFSQKYFTEKFSRESIRDCIYQNYPIENIELFPGLLNDTELKGLNVTIPYKTQIIPYLTDVDTDALNAGAVNVIKITRKTTEDIVIKGFNSDIYGFRETIVPHLRKSDEKALILGTGGASMAVDYVFKTLGIPFVKASILGEPETISYDQINRDLLMEYKIIVNTTPLGMHPSVETFPSIPYEHITKDHILYDLVYNPDMTVFLRKGEERGCRVIGGLKMLHSQAERSWRIWNDPSL
jgi:shikimate dehydrogenase